MKKAAMADKLESLVARLERAVARLESSGVTVETLLPSPEVVAGVREIAAPPALSPSVLDFDALVDGPLKAFADKSAALGGKVKDAGSLLLEAFQKERVVVLAISQCKVRLPPF